MPSDLDLPVVLITGATGPLGHAAAARFARDGARLALISRDKDRLEELGASLDVTAAITGARIPLDGRG